MGPGQAGKDGTGGASQAPSPVLPVPRISGSGLPQMVVVPNSQGPSLQVVWNPLNAAQGAEVSQGVLCRAQRWCPPHSVPFNAHQPSMPT